MNAPKVIKRYQNRKLYDTSRSSYVTLEEIAKMIRRGDDVQVIDNRNQADITATTLTQLLYESEKKTKSQPSLDLLKEVIRFGDGSFSGYIRSKYNNDLEANQNTFAIETNPQAAVTAEEPPSEVQL
jgi:polyhydroxyalkanoate synthesis repressor PhaR